MTTFLLPTPPLLSPIITDSSAALLIAPPITIPELGAVDPFADIVLPSAAPINTTASAELILNNTVAAPNAAFNELLLLCFLCAFVNSETTTQD